MLPIRKMAMTAYFNGKTALVTGGAVRIGRAIALSIAEAGANVIVHYNRSETDAEHTARDIRQAGAEAWLVRADLSDTRQASSLIAEAIAKAGRLDFLVNNASVFPDSSLDDIDFGTDDRLMAINAFSPLALTKAFTEQAKQGAVVNILDNRIFRLDDMHAGYQLSKNTLYALTKMTAVRYAPAFRINGVAPGMILPPPGSDETYLSGRTKRTLLGRHGNPSDIAKAVLFLLSSEFITGEVIVVDGGENLKRMSENGVEF